MYPVRLDQEDFTSILPAPDGENEIISRYPSLFTPEVIDLSRRLRRGIIVDEYDKLSCKIIPASIFLDSEYNRLVVSRQFEDNVYTVALSPFDITKNPPIMLNQFADDSFLNKLLGISSNFAALWIFINDDHARESIIFPRLKSLESVVRQIVTDVTAIHFEQEETFMKAIKSRDGLSLPAVPRTGPKTNLNIRIIPGSLSSISPKQNCCKSCFRLTPEGFAPMEFIIPNVRVGFPSVSSKIPSAALEDGTDISNRQVEIRARDPHFASKKKKENDKKTEECKFDELVSTDQTDIPNTARTTESVTTASRNVSSKTPNVADYKFTITMDSNSEAKALKAVFFAFQNIGKCVDAEADSDATAILQSVINNKYFDEIGFSECQANLSAYYDTHNEVLQAKSSPQKRCC